MATVTATLPVLPFFLQASDEDPTIYYSAADFRQFTSALIGTPGIMTAASFYVDESSPVGWSVTVGAGSACVGNYLVRMTSAVTLSLLTFNTSPAATRTHKVWLVIYDSLITEADINADNASDYNARIVVTEDTGSGAPAPENATAYINLATVSVAPGQSYVRASDITDARPHAAPGAAPFVLTLAEGVTDAAGSANTSPVRAKYMNGQVTLSGAVTKAGGFAIGEQFLLATLPKNFRPNRKKFLAGAAGSADVATDAWRLTISTVGSMFAWIPSGTGPGVLFLDGIVFDLD